jgi:hypothetical protein
MDAMTTGVDMFAQAARGMGRVAGEGLNYVGDTLGTRAENETDEAPTSKKQAEALAEDGVKLVEYVLVNLNRDQEQIVDRGYRVVRKTTTEQRLASELIDAFTSGPDGAGRDAAEIRAYVQILENWTD